MNELPQHAHQVADAAWKGGSALTIGGQFWSWMGSNSPQITAICAIIGAVLAIGGASVSLYRWWRRRK